MSGQAAMRLGGTKVEPLPSIIRSNQNVQLQKLNRGFKNLAEHSELGQPPICHLQIS
jgi:hypothetical protein